MGLRQGFKIANVLGVSMVDIFNVGNAIALIVNDAGK